MSEQVDLLEVTKKFHSAQLLMPIAKAIDSEDAFLTLHPNLEDHTGVLLGNI